MDASVRALVSSEPIIIDGEDGPVVTYTVIEVVTVGLQGPAGASGGGGGTNDDSYTTSMVVSGHHVVALENGLARYASNDVLSDAGLVVGVSLTGAGLGALVEVRRSGLIQFSGWTWSSGDPVFVGADGELTQTPPESPAAAFQLVVGYAVASDTLNVRIGEAIAF